MKRKYLVITLLAVSLLSAIALLWPRPDTRVLRLEDCPATRYGLGFVAYTNRFDGEIDAILRFDNGRDTPARVSLDGFATFQEGQTNWSHTFLSAEVDPIWVPPGKSATFFVEEPPIESSYWFPVVLAQRTRDGIVQKALSTYIERTIPNWMSIVETTEPIASPETRLDVESLPTFSLANRYSTNRPDLVSANTGPAATVESIGETMRLGRMAATEDAESAVLELLAFLDNPDSRARTTAIAQLRKFHEHADRIIPVLNDHLLNTTAGTTEAKITRVTLAGLQNAELSEE